jgi:hypothetical protein
MPKLNNRHANAELAMFSDFSGGLNLARPPETLANNEMQEATNFEFEADTGMLRVRGGLIPVFTFNETASDVMPIAGSNALLVRSGNEIYRLTDSMTDKGGYADHLGEVDGDKRIAWELWADGHNMLMAFGGHLFLYDGMNVNIIDTEDAPEQVEIVLSRQGRVIVAETGSDTVRYSGVGDPMNWTVNLDSDAQSIDIGYKDGCNMKGITAIVGELIVFKCPDGQPELGRVYRLQGDFPDWTVIPYSRGSSAWNQQSIANVSNDILYLTREGLANMATATEYGDFKLGWAGAKINPALAPALSDLSHIVHLPIRSQVWVMDGTSNDVWCYHYHIGDGAWTRLVFPGKVNSVAAANGTAYLAIENTVYRMSNTADGDSGQAILATWKPKTMIKRGQTLVKHAILSYQSTMTADAKFRIGKFELPLPLGGQGDRASTDDDIARLDYDPLFPWLETSMMRKRMNIRRWEITPEIIVKNGLFNFISLGLEVAEV